MTKGDSSLFAFLPLFDIPFHFLDERVSLA